MMSGVLLRSITSRVGAHVPKQRPVVAISIRRGAACLGGRHVDGPTRPITWQSDPSCRSGRCFSSESKGDAPSSDGDSTEGAESTVELSSEGGESSPSGEDVADEEAHQQRPMHFPWRHEDTLPDRLLDNDDYSGMPNNWRGRLVRRVVACRELNLTPLEALPIPFFPQSWEEDLAQNFQTAFELALEELLSNLFRGKVPVKNDGGMLFVDSSIRNVAEKENDDGDDDDDGNDGNKSSQWSGYLYNMMDKKLIEQYQSIDTDNLQLKLSIRPRDATLAHIFAVPLLSRAIVEKKPHLKGGYQRIEQAFAEKKGIGTVKDMTYDLANEIGEDDAYTRTVIADMTMTCSEFFQVKDGRTGLIVQGMEDGAEEEDVVHNVRFEVVTEKGDDGDSARKAGSWKIIDFDDQLEGNVFH